MEFSARLVGVISSFCPYAKSDSGPGSFLIDHRIPQCIIMMMVFGDLNMITSPCMYNSIKSLIREQQDTPMVANHGKQEED